VGLREDEGVTVVDRDCEAERGTVMVFVGVIVAVCEKEVDNELESVKEFVWDNVRLLEEVTVQLSLCVGDGEGEGVEVSDMDKVGECDSVLLRVILGDDVWEREEVCETDSVGEGLDVEDVDWDGECDTVKLNVSESVMDVELEC